MRIGTWNVEYAYAKRLNALRQVLDANSADIWVLTETHDDLIPPNCPYVAHSELRPKNWSGIRDRSRWVSIWSNYPIIELISLDSSDRERTVTAILDLGDSKKLLVYGTVLPWKGDRGIHDWSEHHRVISEQSGEWMELRNRYPDIPLCVAGDFNTDMGTGSYYGTKQGIATMRAGLAQCELFCATEPTRFPKNLLPFPPIDHIALPIKWSQVTSIDSAWPANKPTLSDHSGMIVNVDFLENKNLGLTDATTQPNSLEFDAILCRPKSGNEVLRNGMKELPVALIDFWRWSCSNVLGNSLRGQLAEFIVGHALDCLSEVRQEWDACDLKKGHIRIEVKSASYLQSWKQSKLSSISFDIGAKRGWDAVSNTMESEQSRSSNVYVFCLLHHITKLTVDPLDVTQWKFYLVPTSWLNKHFPNQQRISLASLDKAGCEPANFDELRTQFSRWLTSTDEVDEYDP